MELQYKIEVDRSHGFVKQVLEILRKDWPPAKEKDASTVVF